MPDLMDSFPHLDKMEVHDLHARYFELKGETPGRDLSDEVLAELCAIARVLRKKSAGAPKAASAKSPRISPSLDML